MTTTAKANAAINRNKQKTIPIGTTLCRQTGKRTLSDEKLYTDYSGAAAICVGFPSKHETGYKINYPKGRAFDEEDLPITMDTENQDAVSPALILSLVVAALDNNESDLYGKLANAYLRMGLDVLRKRDMFIRNTGTNPRENIKAAAQDLNEFIEVEYNVVDFKQELAAAVSSIDLIATE